MDSKERLLIVTDGASRGNPGSAASAYLIFENGKEIASSVRYIGKETNNVAEYTAVIDGLSAAKKFGNIEIDILSDSQLLVRQINGQYRVKKPHLQKLYSQVTELLEGFPNWSVTHVKRENKFIQMADALCNKELDRQ